MKSLNQCRFCEISNNYIFKDQNSNSRSIYNTILCETSNFFVVPALGALVPGYIMIISKKHIFSMAYLSKKEMIELDDLVRRLKKFLFSKIEITPILFEHGSGNVSNAANSVEHAHWHLVPVHFSSESKILFDLEAIQLPTLQDVLSYSGKPYILYVDDTERCYISFNYSLPSQYMRRWIAKEIGCPNKWDWRNYEFLENVAMTIDLFGN